jgi:hypothetical protein
MREYSRTDMELGCSSGKRMRTQNRVSSGIEMTRSWPVFAHAENACDTNIKSGKIFPRTLENDYLFGWRLQVFRNTKNKVLSFDKILSPLFFIFISNAETCNLFNLLSFF